MSSAQQSTPDDQLPLVTIGIPTYNRPQGLKFTIQNALGQKYSNLEILVSDNCSSQQQEIESIIALFARDPRLKYFRQSQNIGPINNFEFLLNQAKGKYFILTPDDDDYSDPDFIRSGVDALEANPAASFAYGRVDYIDATGKPFITDRPPYELSGNRFERVRKLIIQDHTDHYVYSMYRTSSIQGFRFIKDVAVFEKILILNLTIEGELADAPKMYYRNNYNLKTSEECRNCGLDVSYLSFLKHHYYWYYFILKSFPFLQAAYLSALYTIYRLPKISWVFRKLFKTQPKPLKSRQIFRNPILS